MMSGLMTRLGLTLAVWTLVVPAATAVHAQTAEAPQTASAPAAAPERDRPLTHLIPNFLRDLRRFPSVDTAILLGAGGALALATHPADDSVAERATAPDPGAAYDIGSAIGNGWTQVGLAVGAYGTGLIARKPKLAHIGSDLIRAQALNAVLNTGIKMAVRRERPGEITSTAYSFPSGHTSSTFATAGVMWRHYGWKAGLPAAAVGTWVGTGRVRLRRHFVSDAVFGAALGLASGRTVSFGHGRRTVVLAPAVVPGGAAAVFTLVER